MNHVKLFKVEKFKISNGSSFHCMNSCSSSSLIKFIYVNKLIPKTFDQDRKFVKKNTLLYFFMQQTDVLEC